MTLNLSAAIGFHNADALNPFGDYFERAESVRRLYKVERSLIWMRRLAMAGWAGTLLWEGHPFGFNILWLLLAASVAYCEILHALLRTQKHVVAVSWIGTICDPLVAFLMCLYLGKSSSVLIPFFYFTLQATTFRYGGAIAMPVLFLNAALVVTLYLLEPAESRNLKSVTFILLYLTYSYVFGSLLAAWAISNLRRAVMQSHALERERDRTQELLHSLINAEEHERKKFAGDLHDGIGERSFSINRGLDECIRAVGDESVRRRLESLRSELLSFTSYIRSFMNELRPTVLDELGLYEAISEHVALISGLVPFKITTDLDPALKAWRSKEDAMLFRLMQEALLNARKHSDASAVVISLKRDGSAVVLTIEDNGRGFDTAHTPVGHFGLLTMRERAELSGGTLNIDSRPGHGTRISVRFDQHGE